MEWKPNGDFGAITWRTLLSLYSAYPKTSSYYDFTKKLHPKSS
jgi:hypothetical protein